jgi:hypothetical protein
MCNIARLLLAFCLLSVYYVVIALYSFCHMYCIVQDQGLEYPITNWHKFINGSKVVYVMKAIVDNR